VLAWAARSAPRPKARCGRAYDTARRADPLAALYDRRPADTLVAAEGQPADARAMMFTRTAIALGVMADRTGRRVRISGRCSPPRQLGERRAGAITENSGDHHASERRSRIRR
jgi:hypothetical protein